MDPETRIVNGVWIIILLICPEAKQWVIMGNSLCSRGKCYSRKLSLWMCGRPLETHRRLFLPCSFPTNPDLFLMPSSELWHLLFQILWILSTIKVSHSKKASWAFYRFTLVMTAISILSGMEINSKYLEP